MKSTRNVYHSKIILLKSFSEILPTKKLVKALPTLKLSLNPSRLSPVGRDKIKLNFYFRTSFWYLRRFYEGLKLLHKTF